MKNRTKIPRGVHFGSRRGSTPSAPSVGGLGVLGKSAGHRAAVAEAHAGMSSAAHTPAARAAQAAQAATDTSSRFSSAEIEELNRMLEKAAPKTLASMSTGRTPLLATDNPEEKRAEIRAYFHATFDKTEQLFGLLTKYVPSRRALSHQIPPHGGLGSHVTISSPVCCLPLPQRRSVLHQARDSAPPPDLLLRSHRVLLRQQAHPGQDRHGAYQLQD